MSQAQTGSTPAAGAGLAALGPGAVVSRYRIESVLGEGGMGTVYLARQEKPDRQVALKVIRAGSIAVEMLRRFELESQVLGRLQHPGIAQIYEAGVFHADDESASRPAVPIPFFAMELVKGVPLTEHADSNRLGTRARLELIAKVCDAVYHAHQKGVIHRDLKPGNILVDESGQPKILDFGVARATDSDLQRTTMQTDVGQLIGTVPYMSPEQIGGDPNDLDTRSDVYALGVIAYELLAGRLPHDLRRKMIHEAARIIREEEPTRLSSVNRALRGDVETIVAKALEKEKTRRYQSAESLASDIRHYLKDEPIAARPASTWYQLSKFSKRNKPLVTGLAVAFLALAAGLVGTAFGLREANRQRDDAVAARDQLREVSEFQADMLSRVDPITAGVRLKEDLHHRFEESLVTATWLSEDQRVAERQSFSRLLTRINGTDAATAWIDRTILAPGTAAVRERFKDQPAVAAALMQVLAVQCRERGLFDAADSLQTDALDLRRRVQGEDHPDTLASVHAAALLFQDSGRLAEAERFFREAVEKRRRVLGDDHPDTLKSINSLGSLLAEEGKLAESELCIREALAKRRRALGEDHPDTLRALSNLGSLLEAQGRTAEAEPYQRDVLEKSRRILGDDDPETIVSINNMGHLLHTAGRYAEAESHYREALEKSRRVMGEEHPATLTTVQNLGILLKAEGKLEEAELYYREALEKKRRALGVEHPATLLSLNSMGFLLQSQGRFAEAERCYLEALEGCRRVLGEDHSLTITVISNVGTLRCVERRFAEAEPYAREALEKSRRVLGEEHQDTLSCINNMGFVLWNEGKFDQAEPLYREALQKCRRVLGEEHPDTLGSIHNLAVLLLKEGKLDEAEPYWRESVEKRRRVSGDLHPDTLGSLYSLAGLLLTRERFADAEPFVVSCVEGNTLHFGPAHDETRDAIRQAVTLYQSWDKADPGKGHGARAAEWKAKLDELSQRDGTLPPSNDTQGTSPAPASAQPTSKDSTDNPPKRP